MDERLSRSNRLPGSEKLTRPEEIGQLSKYLKSIKEVYEESTRLEDQVLGVSGRSTGKIPVIEELGKKVIKAPENEGESIDLSRKILNVPDNGVKLERLRDKKIEVPDVKGGVNLEDEKISRPGNENPEVTRLSEVIKKIEDVRNSSLSGKRVDIEDDQRDIALSDKRLDLQAMINASLRNKRIELGGEVPETKLADKRIELKDESKVELGDKRISLSDNRENQLETKKIKISDEKEIKLGEKRLDIQDAGVNGLSNKRIDLSAEENIELGDKKVKIYDERQTELENKRVNINPESDLKLSEKRLDIKDESNPKLEDTRINLFDERNLELSEKRLDLKDEHEVGLRDKRLDLKDEREDRLEDKRLDLKDERKNELENKRIDLKDDRENRLEDKRLDLKDERENELEDKRLDLKDERENKLEDKRLDLKDERDNKLEDKRLDLKDERENALSDKILELFDNRENRLGDKRLDLKDDRENSLEDKRLDLKDDRENSLSDKILSLDVDNPIELEDKRLDLKDEREDRLEDKRIGILENENGEPEELYDQYIGMLDNENGEPEELYDALLQLPENENPDYPNIDNIESLKEYTASLSDSELYEFAMKIANEGEMDGWLSKVESLMSAYLSSDILTPKRAIQFRDAINNTLEMGYFGNLAGIEYRQNNREGDGSKDSSYIYTNPETGKPLNIGEKSKPIPFPESKSETVKDGDVENLKPGFLRVPIDTSSGTIWAKAENKVPDYITGTNRRDALDEMIVKMVDYKKVSLPGGNIIDTVKDNIPKNASDVISGSISHNYPVNAPIGLNGLTVPGGPGDAIYQAANNRTRMDSLDHVGDVIGNTFYSRYWSSKSFKTTLEDLCPIAGKAPVASLSELKAILKSSPYFTSPGKFMTDAKGSYNTMTLDTNMYWEVTIEPFCCDSGSCSNGGYSYLPDIREINYLNKEIHKVRTNYGRWAPINSFELQKSKLQTKSLQLFEGEIAYPSGMEFTNELRLTFVDDSWKSWKRYFERCAQASVFNTNEKKKDDYESEFNDSYITRIDKTNVCVASYKNVTFNIKIYILNPQLNLLNRFNLLCVLKDFSEEYVGDIDSGGTDLNVSFSIVGENPEEDSSKKFSLDKEVIARSLGLQAALETQKRVTAAINSSVGLL